MDVEAGLLALELLVVLPQQAHEPALERRDRPAQAARGHHPLDVGLDDRPVVERGERLARRPASQLGDLVGVVVYARLARRRRPPAGLVQGLVGCHPGARVPIAGDQLPRRSATPRAPGSLATLKPTTRSKLAPSGSSAARAVRTRS